MAQNPNSKVFGPDDNMPLNRQLAKGIVCPPQARLEISFYSAAFWEQALIIYDEEFNEVVERGTFGRTLSRAETPFNTTNSPFTYYFTGWHKETPESANQPWIQSPGRIRRSDGINYEIGFEDGRDGDFDDIGCWFNIAFKNDTRSFMVGRK